MKRLLFLASLLLVVAATPASAQWHVNRRGVANSDLSTGRGYFPEGGSRYSGGYYPSVYIPTYVSSGSYTPGLVQGQFVPGYATPAYVTMDAPMAPPAANLYIPSYLRPDDGGPSLAEKAAGLKAAKNPAVLKWSNWPDTAKTEKRD